MLDWRVAQPKRNLHAVAGSAPGTLFLVGTPIGNLEDITLRALRVLKEVDLIACEDTRHSATLLNHYGIDKPTISYHEHNEQERAAQLIERLQSGESVAVVSDAGMPGISDPGYRLVSLAAQHGLRVVPVPGSAAFLSALVASGLSTDSFRFGGFLPSKAGARRTALEAIRGSRETQVFYEAPHRILESLRDVAQVLGGERQVVVARELTKVHEELLRGRASELLAQLEQRGEVRGEITLLIGKAEEAAQTPTTKSVAHRVREMMRDQQLDEKTALKQAAKEFGLSKSEAYRELQRAKPQRS